MKLQPNDQITNGNQTLTVKKIMSMDSIVLIQFTEFPKRLINFHHINFEGWKLI